MPSPGAGISGGVAWNSSLPWLDGGCEAGACCCGALSEEELPLCGTSPAPLPGVMGPSTPENGGGGCGVGASGTAGCCCWARAAVDQVELRTAASAIAVKPSFTGISSSRTPRGPSGQTAQTPRANRNPLRNRLVGLHSTDYQTRRRRAGLPCVLEAGRVCSLRGSNFVYMTSMRRFVGVTALLLGLPGLCPAAWAQLAPSPDAPPVSNAPAPSPDEESVATFKVEVNLVNVFFTVKDKAGNLVPHLTKDDCAISEETAPSLKTRRRKS